MQVEEEYFPRHVDFFSGGGLTPDNSDHNDIVMSWEEVFTIAGERHFIMRGAATHDAYWEQMELKAA
jgi:hypothetical protein